MPAWLEACLAMGRDQKDESPTFYTIATTKQKNTMMSTMPMLRLLLKMMVVTTAWTTVVRGSHRDRDDLDA